MVYWSASALQITFPVNVTLNVPNATSCSRKNSLIFKRRMQLIKFNHCEFITNIKYSILISYYVAGIRVYASEPRQLEFDIIIQ